jgi:ankyrin repeat protein
LFAKCTKKSEFIIQDEDNDPQKLLIAVGGVEQENILHICAKRRVSSTLFNLILDKLSANNKGMLMQAPDSNGNLPLHLAARTNKEESYICEELIKEMKQINDSHSSSGGFKQHSLILDILSAKNRLDKTAAHEASEQGYGHILKLMWDAISPEDQKNRGKGLYTTNNNRFTCLHLAAMKGNDKGKQLCTR